MFIESHHMNLELRKQDLAQRMAERRNQALAASRRPSLRGRLARIFFALAGKREAWSTTPESSEAGGRA